MSEQRAISIDDLVDLNDHWQRRSVKAEAELAYALNQLVKARAHAIEECAKIAMTAGCGDPQCMDCYGNQIAATIRDLALPTAIEVRGILTDDLRRDPDEGLPTAEDVRGILKTNDQGTAS